MSFNELAMVIMPSIGNELSKDDKVIMMMMLIRNSSENLRGFLWYLYCLVFHNSFTGELSTPSMILLTKYF